MPQHYDPDSRTHVTTDEDGVVRSLAPEKPVASDASTAQLAAQEFLDQHGELLGFAPAQLENLTAARATEPEDAGNEIRLHTEKQQFDTTTVTYDQTHFGLPVWEAGVSVHLKNEPYRVVAASSTHHDDVEVAEPGAADLERFKDLDEKTLADLLGLHASSKDYDRKSLQVQNTRLVIYRYEEARRTPESEPHDEESSLAPHEHPVIPLPALPASIAEGGHYVSCMVHFELNTPAYPTLNWRAIIDVSTGAVLHLRAFVDNVTGLVFQVDPITSAPSGPPPSATSAALNPKRSSHTLLGLVPPVLFIQHLRGNLVTVQDVETPTIAPPVRPAGSNFDYDARTNDFGAVNAYYHCDRFFRLVQGMGFSLPAYFGATPFPSITDHRGLGGNVINAHCVGLPGGVGIQQTTFGLADLGDVVHPICIAADWRVVLHELGGHGILYPHVHSPNFGFAHSAGDSHAAILNDPGSAAPDRGVTFPWVNIGRRHDRPVASWAWDGPNDVGGYSTEQILSTTHFRIYRSIGGDSPVVAGLGGRQFAARFTSYLIFRAVGSLTPATNPPRVDQGYVQALLAADLGDWTSEGHAGGAYGKVIRWAFEKQGLFQPAGTPRPITNVGAPPAVDVYINDGRNGEYPYQPVYWDNHSIWNRRHPDGLTTHEAPVVGVTNYAYVKIKNRGTQAATGVKVKAFHANPSIGLVYPNDWQPMSTPSLAAPNVAANNAATITVGPFKWVPTHAGHECMFMIVTANGDPSNVSNLSAGESIPEWRLVPHDNNIGQRNVAPVPFSSLEKWVAEFGKLRFTLKNPLAVTAKTILSVTLPRLLVDRGWKLTFTNPGGGALSLKPAETKEITMQLVPGKAFTAAELAKQKDAVIRIAGYANGIQIGGMTYEVAPAATKQ